MSLDGLEGFLRSKPASPPVQLPSDPMLREELWILDGGEQTYAEFIADPARWLPKPPRGGTAESRPPKPVGPPNTEIRY